jgi:DNA-binding MarR family transcriptional regulator
MVAAPVETTADELTPRENDLGTRISDAMMGLSRQWTAVASQLAKLGIDRTSMILLHALTAMGPMRSNALAEAVFSDPSTISRQVAGLVKDGLIERRADPADGRASLLAVTEKGHQLLETRKRQKSSSIARFLAHWPEADRERFAELLERFVSDHERHIPDIIGQCAAEQARTAEEN